MLGRPSYSMGCSVSMPHHVRTCRQCTQNNWHKLCNIALAWMIQP